MAPVFWPGKSQGRRSLAAQSTGKGWGEGGCLQRVRGDLSMQACTYWDLPGGPVAKDSVLPMQAAEFHV